MTNLIQSAEQGLPIPIIEGGYYAPNIIANSYLTTHLNTNVAALGISVIAPGSSANGGGGSQDMAIAASVQQQNYLTNTGFGEFDTLYLSNYQGVNATGDILILGLEKRAATNGLPGNGAQALEFQSRLVNASGLQAGALYENHGYMGELFYQDGHFGGGFCSEQQVSVAHWGFCVDTYDNHVGTAGAPPDYLYAFLGRKNRDDAQRYFSVDTAGDIWALGSGTFNNYISSVGANSGYLVARRDTGATAFLVYSAGGNLQFYNGTIDAMSMDNNGNVAVAGGAPSASSMLSVPASTTAKSQLRLAAGTAPTSPTNGDIWFDGTNLKIRIGGATKIFTVV